MSQVFNIYCDENCHLENDNQEIMVLGGIWCPLDKTKDISKRLREIKANHCLSKSFETKWTKVSPGQKQFYLDTIDYFFDNDDLHFRGLIVKNKSELRHEEYQQDHDDWYYKMYFTMLKAILEPSAHYRIYLDIKDTHSSDKVGKLHDILANNMYDFSRKIIERVQTVRSHEIEVLQLADLLIGAVSYANRNLSSSEAKLELIAKIKERSRYQLNKTTLYRENKMNLFFWEASAI